MKQILITISLFILMLVVNFTDIHFKLIILIILAILICQNQILLTNLILKKTFAGELIIRKRKSDIGVMSIIIAVLWTISAALGQRSDNYIAILFWMIPILEIISNRIYKHKKPVSLVISRNELLINHIWTIKRNLENLVKIQQNGFSDNLTFSFTDKPQIVIKRNEYEIKDIKCLLALSLTISKQEVELTDNIKSLLNSR